MGNLCGGGHKGTPEDNKANAQINQELRKDKTRLESEIKLLLLGAGESGKSTVAKQMKIIHLDGFTKEECESYKSIIAANVVGSMRVLVKAAADMGFNISEDNRSVIFVLKFVFAGFSIIQTSFNPCETRVFMVVQIVLCICH